MATQKWNVGSFEDNKVSLVIWYDDVTGNAIDIGYTNETNQPAALHISRINVPTFTLILDPKIVNKKVALGLLGPNVLGVGSEFSWPATESTNRNKEK